MGNIPENEQKWQDYVMANNVKCKICGQKIPFGEREVYFERGLCGYCAHKEDKDD